MNSAEGLVKRPFGVYEVCHGEDFGTWTAVTQSLGQHPQAQRDIVAEVDGAIGGGRASFAHVEH